MSDLAADAGKPPHQQRQQSSQAKPPVSAETRLNANAKSFTPSATGAPPPPPPTTVTTTPAAGAAAPAHLPAKQPPPTRHAGTKTPPPGAGTKGSPASGAQAVPPPAPHLPPAQSTGKKGMMMMMPPPPRFPEMAGMIPGMPPPMPGAASTGGMMSAGFLPPPPPPPPVMMPPPNGMMFQQPGTPGGMPHHHHHPAGMATPQQHLASQHQQQHGMMPMWMPPPPTHQHQHQHQQPGMMMPMNSMMPMPMSMSIPMPMGAASSPMPPGQRSSGPQQHPPQQPGMMMPFYPPPQAPHGTMPPMASMPPPAPGMGMPRAPPPTPGAAPGGTMIPPQAAGAAATAAMMAPPPHHSYMHPHPGSNTASGANAVAPTSSINSALNSHNNTQNHINTGMQAAASRPASMMPPPPPPPPPMMMLNHTGNTMMPPPPPPPPLPLPPPTVAANARVSVGNATLAALNSKEPPKFSCVLLSGIPAVGKTTLGRELVNSLKTDGMGWAFFSGADFLTEQQGKRSIWETTKDVFDALSSRLDELLERQHKDRNIKGLVIDKNCKGIEDVYYLSALLLSKSIPFVGIVGMECAEDDVLVRRMGGDDYLKEKLKFHRVIHARIVSLAKSAGMYRYVDATKSKEEVVQMLRTMVLGCCAQPPARSIGNHQYDDSRANIMVDDYKEYSEVLTHLFRCVNNRGSQFPGSTDLVPFSEKEMKDKGRINAIKSRYGIRRKVDGHRYLLVYREKRLYLVPPHMRAVLQMPLKAWLGSRLDSDGVGMFVLEGDLTRLTRDRQKELFLVYDAHYWSDAVQPSSNKMIRMTFSERQAFLAANMCSESKAFFAQDGVECVVVHQPTQKMSEAVDMLDSEEYPSDGLVFQAVNPIHRSDHVFVWQQPSCMTVDFRVGQLLDTRQPPETDADGIPTSMKVTTSDPRRNASGTVSPQQQQQQQLTARRGNVDAFSDHPIRTFMLEVYDKTEKMYVQYENATVDVRHPDVVEGCIVTCSLVDGIPRRWVFRRIRYDVLRPIYKLDLEELLGSCLIPRAKLVAWLLNEQIVPSEIQLDGNGSGAGGSGSATNVPNVPPPSYDAAAAAVAAASAKGAAASMGMMQSLATPLPTHGMMPPPMSDIGSPPAFHAPTAAAATAIPTAPGRSIYPSASAMLSRVAAVPAIPAPPPAVPGPRLPLQLSTEAQLKQLASIVPSFHVVDGSKESGAAAVAVAVAAASSTPATAGSNGTAAGLAGKNAASRATGGAASDGSRNCAQCHKPKQSEDLRIDRRDHRPYCYSCWAKSGYGFCAVCGEFKEVRRESRGRHKGSSVCTPCGRATAAPADAASNNASPASGTTAAAVVKTAASAPTTPAASAAAREATDAKVDAVLPSTKARKKAAVKEKKAVGVPPATDEAVPSTGCPTPTAAAAAAKPAGGEGGKTAKVTGDGGRAVAQSAPSSPTTGKGGGTAHGGKKKDSAKVSSSSPDASTSASLPDAAAEAALSQAPKSEKPTKSAPTEVDAAPAPAAPAVAEAPAAKPEDSKVAEPLEEAVAAPAAPAASTAVQDSPRAPVHEEKRSGGGCRQQ